jgi:DNA invertase Pin-like site-specific DNA recombinase
VVCHSCDNPKCVKPSHLFLGTQEDNLQDMKSKDRHLKGDRNAVSKLDDDKVRQIHLLSKQGLSQGKIAKTFGVGQSTVWKILQGERWNHIYLELSGLENNESN